MIRRNCTECLKYYKGYAEECVSRPFCLFVHNFVEKLFKVAKVPLVTNPKGEIWLAVDCGQLDVHLYQCKRCGSACKVQSICVKSICASVQFVCDAHNAPNLYLKMPYYTCAHITYSMMNELYVRRHYLYQTHCMCTRLHNTQIKDSLMITTFSHETLSYNPQLSGTWITTYSEIWFVEGNLVSVQQCSVHTERKRKTEPSKMSHTDLKRNCSICKRKFIQNQERMK